MTTTATTTATTATSVVTYNRFILTRTNKKVATTERKRWQQQKPPTLFQNINPVVTCDEFNDLLLYYHLQRQRCLQHQQQQQQQQQRYTIICTSVAYLTLQQHKFVSSTNRRRRTSSFVPNSIDHRPRNHRGTIPAQQQLLRTQSSQFSFPIGNTWRNENAAANKYNRIFNINFQKLGSGIVNDSFLWNEIIFMKSKNNDTVDHVEDDEDDDDDDFGPSGKAGSSSRSISGDCDGETDGKDAPETNTTTDTTGTTLDQSLLFQELTKRKNELRVGIGRRYICRTPFVFLNIHSDPGDPYDTSNIVGRLYDNQIVTSIRTPIGDWIYHDQGGWSISQYGNFTWLKVLEE